MRVVIDQMRPDGWKGKGKTSKVFKLGAETLAIRMKRQPTGWEKIFANHISG